MLKRIHSLEIESTVYECVYIFATLPKARACISSHCAIEINLATAYNAIHSNTFTKSFRIESVADSVACVMCVAFCLLEIDTILGYTVCPAFRQI